MVNGVVVGTFASMLHNSQGGLVSIREMVHQAVQSELRKPDREHSGGKRNRTVASGRNLADLSSDLMSQYNGDDYYVDYYATNPTAISQTDEDTEDRGTFLNLAITDNDQLVQTTLNRITEYGCWCYFDGRFNRGRGQPINDIDELCRAMHHGYQCAILDGQLEGIPCVPWEINYNGTNLLDFENIASSCADINPASKCAERACTIEKFFVSSIVSYVLSGKSFDITMAHSEGFDPTMECPTKSHIESDLACCGEYPKIFPYKTLDGARGCCPKICKTFDASRLQCCDSAETQFLALAGKDCPLTMNNVLAGGHNNKRRK